jgi:4-hydroxyproline epimerase
MSRSTFFCIDAHTCGNPVRVVVGGGPDLQGANMSEKRQDFVQHHDWIRRCLMFEPRGHDIMSGTVLYPPLSANADMSLLFIETSGCLPMCGHGTIGTVTVMLEHGLVRNPQVDGQLTLDVPAGQVVANYSFDHGVVESVTIHNIASYLAVSDLVIDCPELGPIHVDIVYGGNFYAIIDPQKNFSGLESMSANDLLRLSPLVRDQVNQLVDCTHPDDPTVSGVSHVMWTGTATQENSTSANAVFYGDNAIDRSPCGTGTSARMAQLHARGRLGVGEDFIHESIIGSQFTGRIESLDQVGQFDAIRPSITGWARVTGLNQIFADDRDPYVHGFQLR